MFRCETCDRISELGEPAKIIVVATRDVSFAPRLNVHKFKREKKWVFRDDKGGVGKQIVRELQICTNCDIDKILGL